MGDVRARLVETTDAVVDGGRALAQTSDLREHEPHPVGPLATTTQLGESCRIRAAGVLRLDEPLEVGTRCRSHDPWCR